MKWEMFLDKAYFDMYAVRPEGDKDFNSPQLFHFSSHDDALVFMEVVERAIIAEKTK